MANQAVSVTIIPLKGGLINPCQLAAGSRLIDFVDYGKRKVGGPIAGFRVFVGGVHIPRKDMEEAAQRQVTEPVTLVADLAILLSDAWPV